MADPPSQQKSVDGAMTPPSAAVRLTASSRGKTASSVAPVRSRATMTGICSADRPRLMALPPRLREGLGRPLCWPLKDSRMNVSSASTIPDRDFGLSWFESGKKSMTPPERRRVIYRATLRRLRDGLSADQGSRLIDPAILVMQSGQGRPRQRRERLPAGFAAISRHAVRAAPGADREIAAVRTAKTGDPIAPDL